MRPRICGFAICGLVQKICLLPCVSYAVVDLLVVSSRYTVVESTLMMIHLHT
jgi:hypothetical protein